MEKHPLKGSERSPLPGATLIGPADPQERLEVTVLLRQSATASLQARVERLNRGDYSVAPLTREAFAAAHGASTADIAAVKSFAAAHHLAVASADAARRTVVLSGTVENFSAAFGVELQNFEHESGAYRGRQGAVNLPPELQDIVQAVLGLDNRPQARIHLRRPRAAAGATPVSYTPVTVGALYGFPAGSGAGQTIGIIELGGGYKTADLKTYFTGLGIKPPKIVSVSVDHGKNHATGSADGPDGEVMLDIEVAGSIAPGADLVVYFTPNTDAGFLDAITTAIHDTTHKPSVISISWGGPESSWTAQSLSAFNTAFQEAAAMGVTICVAAGDNGSTDGETDGANHVDFPASSPYALACGGTSLRASGSSISSESVWNDGAQGGATGGGMSGTFAAPAYQAGLAATLTAGGTTPLANRGVPDVSGDADPETGYQVRVDGSNTVIGGTSAVAPLWAGLIARLNAVRTTGPVGFLNPILYKNPAALNDITSGNNGAYAAAKGWDACSGLGSPNGQALAALLAGGAAGSVQDQAFLVRGNDKPAGAGELEDQAFLVRGNEKGATTGELKDKAFLVRGD
jgi:kumamolisin